jgi:hypothetical protein
MSHPVKHDGLLDVAAQPVFGKPVFKWSQDTKDIIYTGGSMAYVSLHDL